MADVAESTTVATEAPATRTSDNPVVVEAIQKHLDAFADIGEPVTPEVKSAPVEDSPATEVSTDGETPASTPVTEAEPEKDIPVAEAAPAAAETPSESTLPAAYVRTAKSRGWTDQEVTDFAKANPDLAMKTFERMHESRTKEINEWAELGRKARQTSGDVPSSAATQTAPAPAPLSSPSGLQPINVQEMVQKYGNEDLIKELAGPVNAAIAVLGPIVQDAMTAREQTKRVQQETLGKTVQGFFTSKDLAPYADAYGKDVATLTSQQIEMRGKVLETADALIAGAAFQGRTLSVQDALTLAHDSVSSGMKENIIRDKIRSTVQKRGRGLTLKPTATGRPAQGGPPRDKAELLSRTEDRLARAFG
jgi:hypothetical protein